MGLLGSESSGNRLDALLENARGTSVTETRLTRVGSKILGTGTFEERPLVDYLREDEQLHHVLHNEAGECEFEFDGEDQDCNAGYWQTLVVTDHRLLLLAGREAGDYGEVGPYDVVEPDSVVADKEGLSGLELRMVAGDVECEFEIAHRSNCSLGEVEAAASYAEAHARGGVSPPERERSRGLVYEVPTFPIEATIWRVGDDGGGVFGGRDRFGGGGFSGDGGGGE